MFPRISAEGRATFKTRLLVILRVRVKIITMENATTRGSLKHLRKPRRDVTGDATMPRPSPSQSYRCTASDRCTDLNKQIPLFVAPKPSDLAT
jgi:hypothetical protein